MRRAKRDVHHASSTHLSEPDAQQQPSRRTRRKGRDRDGDRGFTVIEILCCISLMGIVMAPIMNAVIQTVRTSSSTLDSAQVDTVVQNAADRVNRAPTSCSYSVFAQAAAQTHGWAAGQATVSVKRYVPGATPVAQGTWVDGACAGETPAEFIVQLVAITVSSPNGKVSRTIEVIKSDV